MWHPNKVQWIVIWTSVILGLLLTSDFGIGAFAAAILIGALLVWQLEGRRKKQLAEIRAQNAGQQKRLDEEATARRTRNAETEAIRQRAMYAGLDEEARRALRQREEVGATRGDTAEMLKVAEMHKIENQQIKAKDRKN